MIEFQNISFCYEGGLVPSLYEINLKIQQGEFILLSGRSGCGKTTLSRMLNGLIPNFYHGELTGDVLLDGKSILSMDINNLSGVVGTVFQDPRSQFFMMDSTAELAFSCENMGYPQEEILKRVSNTVVELELESLINRNIFALSSGEKQQVAIGSVHTLKPRIYVLDEPSANLDFRATRKLTAILRRLKECGYTIVISEHKFYYLRELIDRVIYLEYGRINRIFSKEEFLNIGEKERCKLGLRPVYPEKLLKSLSDKDIQNHFHYINSKLTVEQLCFSYKRGKQILKDISFHSNSGEIIGILGKNGTGKTTLVSLLCGLLKEKSGSIYYNDYPVSHKKRQEISYLVMQDADYQLFGSSVEEELSLGSEKIEKETVEEILNSLGLEGMKDRHPASLSGGQKQRVTIGSAMMKGSPILIFDEPTSGLDYDSMIKVSKLIFRLSKQGRIIFLISHDFEFITKTCTRILSLQKGQIVEDEKISKQVICHLSELYFKQYNFNKNNKKIIKATKEVV